MKNPNNTPDETIDAIQREVKTMINLLPFGIRPPRNRNLEDEIRRFFKANGKAIRTALDCLDGLSSSQMEATYVQHPELNPYWEAWLGQARTVFEHVLEEAKDTHYEQFRDMLNLPENTIPLEASPYEAIERALGYAKYWVRMAPIFVGPFDPEGTEDIV